MNERYSVALLMYRKIVEENLKILVLNFNIVKFP